MTYADSIGVTCDYVRCRSTRFDDNDDRNDDKRAASWEFLVGVCTLLRYSPGFGNSVRAVLWLGCHMITADRCQSV
jgi:hypothetical protein